MRGRQRHRPPASAPSWLVRTCQSKRSGERPRRCRPMRQPWFSRPSSRNRRPARHQASPSVRTTARRWGNSIARVFWYGVVVGVHVSPRKPSLPRPTGRAHRMLRCAVAGHSPDSGSGALCGGGGDVRSRKVSRLRYGGYLSRRRERAESCGLLRPYLALTRPERRQPC